MSASARRLSGTVATGRFDWQPARVAAVAAGLVDAAPGGGRAPHPFADTHDLLLPSVLAERTRAIEREIYDKGYADAERECTAAAAARLDPVMARLVTTIDEVAGLRADILRRTERDLVQLAIAMAERILRRELRHDPELLVLMARVALDRLGENLVAEIHLNPEDFEATAASRDSSSQAVTVVADPAIVRGGCRVQAEFGTIDVGIASQVHELARALLGDVQETEPSDGVTIRS